MRSLKCKKWLLPLPRSKHWKIMRRNYINRRNSMSQYAMSSNPRYIQINKDLLRRVQTLWEHAIELLGELEKLYWIYQKFGKSWIFAVFIWASVDYSGKSGLRHSVIAKTFGRNILCSLKMKSRTIIEPCTCYVRTQPSLWIYRAIWILSTIG